MNSQDDRKEFWLGLLGLIIYIVLDVSEARYFRPKLAESSMKSAVECHDDPNKCWITKKIK